MNDTDSIHVRTVQHDPTSTPWGLRATPFFIVASPRSGTTLLERMLNRHSRLFTPPETEFFFLLKQKGLLTRPFDVRLARGFIAYYQTTQPATLLGLSEDDALAERLTQDASSWSEVFLRLIDLLSKGTGKVHLGEKTPHHVRCLDYLLNALPTARFVGLVRDGRAVVRSRMEHPQWEHNWYTAAKIWRQDVQAWQVHASGAHAGRLCLVRYENLLQDPERELNRICAFLGEDYEPAMLDESLQPGAEKYSAYYQQHWMAKSTKAIDPSRATSWVKNYAPREFALVEHLLRKQLDALDYSPMAENSSHWYGLYLREWLRHLRSRTTRTLGKHLRTELDADRTRRLSERKP